MHFKRISALLAATSLFLSAEAYAKKHQRDDSDAQARIAKKANPPKKQDKEQPNSSSEKKRYERTKIAAATVAELAEALQEYSTALRPVLEAVNENAAVQTPALSLDEKKKGKASKTEKNQITVGKLRTALSKYELELERMLTAIRQANGKSKAAPMTKAPEAAKAPTKTSTKTKKPKKVKASPAAAPAKKGKGKISKTNAPTSAKKVIKDDKAAAKQVAREKARAAKAAKITKMNKEYSITYSDVLNKLPEAQRETIGVLIKKGGLTSLTTPGKVTHKEISSSLRMFSKLERQYPGITQNLKKALFELYGYVE